MTGQEFLSRYCPGGIRSELPSGDLGFTITALRKLARRGDEKATTCIKLFGRNERGK